MKKGKIINFELLWDTQDDPWPIKLKLISEDMRKAAEEGYNLIVGIMLVEGIRPIDEPGFLTFMNSLESLGKKIGIKEIILVTGSSEKFKNINVPYKLYHVNCNLTIAYNSYKNLLSDLPFYNSINKQFLFLTGIATRPNRVGLLSKFYDNKLLENSAWSFFYPATDGDRQWCRNYLAHYDDLEYEKFITDCQRSVDDRYTEYNKFQRDDFQNQTDINWIDIRHTEFCKNETFINSKVFRNTAFSIISESTNYWNENFDFVTEKTWRTIIHRHPFIFAGHPDQFIYLKDLGLKTFENYMKIKDYWYIKDENKRLDAIVENTKDFLMNHSKYSENIQEDVRHNFSLFLSLAKEELSKLKMLMLSHGVDTQDVEYYFDRTGFDHLIRVPNEQR